MPQGTFSAQVSDWVRQTKERQLAVFQESAQRVIAMAQTPVGQGGNMPVKTGFLRASGQAVIGEALPSLTTNPNPESGAFGYDASAVNLVISNATIRDTITFAYAANYAAAQEYGTHGHAGRRFVALAAQQWPGIVAQVCREAEGRANL
jgi:hypothetical protein